MGIRYFRRTIDGRNGKDKKQFHMDSGTVQRGV